MIFVTDDGERSMNTYLGACVELGPEDVEPDVVAQAKVTYFEGYLWDPPRAKEAIRECARIAHENGREVSMTLSDSFCVDRYRAEFLDLMRSGTVDIVFANRQEVLSLYETEDFEEALNKIAKDCKIAAVTMSEDGAVILKGNERWYVDAIRIEEVVDTTGAGDLFASGFLYGYTQGRTLEDCGKLGCLAAGIVIQQIGPRPDEVAFRGRPRSRRGLFEGLARIGAPDFRLRHPAYGAVGVGMAPVAVAFADIDHHARLQLGDDRRRGLRLTAHVDVDGFALALHPRGGDRRTLTR